MKKLLFLILLATAYGMTSAQENFQYYYGQAREADKGSDNTKFYEMIVKANELHPYHQGVMYYRGVAAALTNRPAEGVNFLREAVLVNAKFDLSIEPLLCLSGQEEFESLKLLQKELLQPVIHSDTAFIIKDRTIHLETVTAGEKEGVFYLASIHKRKIIRVDKGNVTDLLKVETHSSIAILSI